MSRRHLYMLLNRVGKSATGMTNVCIESVFSSSAPCGLAIVTSSSAGSALFDQRTATCADSRVLTGDAGDYAGLLPPPCQPLESALPDNSRVLHPSPVGE